MGSAAESEESYVHRRLKERLAEINAAANEHLAAVDDHINLTLQKAYFKCGLRCHEGRGKQREVNDCVMDCKVPWENAWKLYYDEIAEVQKRINKSLQACHDKYDAAKLRPGQGSSNPLNDWESCIDLTVWESFNEISSLVANLKSSLGIED